MPRAHGLWQSRRRRARRAQVSCFGLGMVALDIRQESTRHSDALDAITNHLGIGSYKRAFLGTAPDLGGGAGGPDCAK